MDIGAPWKWFAEQFGEYFNMFISTLLSPGRIWNPDAGTDLHRLPVFMLISVLLGAILNCAVSGQPISPNLAVPSVVTLALWIVHSLCVFGICRVLGGAGGFQATTSVSLQLLAALNVVSNFAALVWGALARMSLLDGLIKDRDLWLDVFVDEPILVCLVIQGMLMLIYFPIALKRVHNFGRVRQLLTALTPVPGVLLAAILFWPSPVPSHVPSTVPSLVPSPIPSPVPSPSEVTVEGEVVSTTSIPGGFKFTLDCDTEQFVLLMWHEVYDECRDAPKINVGAKARATGQVREYEGELQIQPDWGGDVKAIEEATTWPTQRGTGSLTSSDEGQRVMIEGRVIDVQEFDTRITVFVDDGTGEIRVFIWRDVLDRVDNKTALHIPGSRVRVFGKVDVYRGNLEVKPALPVDVTVLETP